MSFQTAIALHESNGIDIIIALVLNDINPLGKQRMDLVLELKVCDSIAHFVIHLRFFLLCFVLIKCHIYSVEAHKVFEITK